MEEGKCMNKKLEELETDLKGGCNLYLPSKNFIYTLIDVECCFINFTKVTLTSLERKKLHVFRQKLQFLQFPKF